MEPLLPHGHPLLAGLTLPGPELSSRMTLNCHVRIRGRERWRGYPKDRRKCFAGDEYVPYSDCYDCFMDADLNVRTHQIIHFT